MIYDKLSNIHKYYGINKNLDKAITWLKTNNYLKVELGVTKIDEDIFVKRIKCCTLKDEELVNEIHYKYADIHLYVNYEDNITYLVNPELKSTDIVAEYNAIEDIVLYKNNFKEGRIPVKENTFAIFLPFEAHAPKRNHGQNEIEKIIIKVKW
ncbi:YhcH/YjgK/YiaL family protein [Mycoplasmopsis alligatoris]|uniref:Uncharacterized protein, YhcH/YjgK/YiaL family n=1 Tax=Mycoplasmopsis alligatoris A21JP2 TaxID=747682 RepID=D4XX22_9BACT|nr:YhcH/YjgK/YiaL family protein [Mycoplasmopsis alligatoris]EFF41106.1 uncharacterized protein, YhcH/YjgK/YiaL family [Mycoplasmopsis alligatoris A21JP2]